MRRKSIRMILVEEAYGNGLCHPHTAVVTTTLSPAL